MLPVPPLFPGSVAPPPEPPGPPGPPGLFALPPPPPVDVIVLKTEFAP